MADSHQTNSSIARRRTYNNLLTFNELKSECKRLGINNSVEYKIRHRDHPGFPSHPERFYAREWISYKDFFDISDFVPYEDLVKIVHPLNLNNAKEYKKFVSNQNDPTLPNDPQTAYSYAWENWYRFLGKEEPFKPDYIHPHFKAWADRINEFMKEARGGESKISSICRFVRLFIEPHDKSTSPEIFLTQDRYDIKPYRVILDNFETDNLRRNVIKSVNEFLDYVIDKHLTVEDEETGEIARVMGARNPLSLLLTDQSVTAPSRSESTKPSLPYHFVKKAQEWIIPPHAKHFKDLKHLQSFEADWVKVRHEDIDRNDPDCVFRKVDGNFFMWVPTDWIHTFTLTKVPLRGRQIAYNDSGEGDKYIADIDTAGKLVWQINQSSFAGMTNNQAFIKKMPDGGVGIYVTTNKTSNNGEGYSIPWMPEDMAYWLIKLRKWQQKYNPINAPTSWLSCNRTSFNEQQLKARGINCFLFRAYQDVEPKNVSTALAPRLAIALHNIQPSNLTLAECSGDKANISSYSSPFTPHSMRVSLITAYVMEMGMPIEVVMKVVGHSSVVMTIYYTKVSHSEIKRRLEEGEKIALKSQAEATQRLIEQNKIEQVKNQLVGSSEDMLRNLTNSLPAANFVFRDYGICPIAASGCVDGGEIIGSTQVRSPVPAGYLGMQNCLRCRHFISGPAFLGGLLAVTNEILLQSNRQSQICQSMQEKLTEIVNQLRDHERTEYQATKTGQAFDNKKRMALEAEERRLESDYESAAKKLDMFLCDLQAGYRLIRQSQNVMKKSKNCLDEDQKNMLIISDQAELQIDLEEVSYFQQLQEVCENASIYQSATADTAIMPRSQIFDRMAMFNNMAPALLLLSEEEQLRVGNELFRLIKSRLSSWSRIDQLINCEIRIDELLGTEKISKTEIQVITKSNMYLEEVVINDHV